MNTNNKSSMLELILRNLHWYCIGISIISLIFICVNEELIPGFIPSWGNINPDGVNGVVSVIGCSFIAGYIFYLLTCAIPNYVKNKETNKLVLEHVKVLNSWVDVCNQPIAQLQSYIKNKRDDKAYYPQDKEYEVIHSLILKIDEEAKPLVLNSMQPIYKYFTYLTPKQQEEIEKIISSVTFLWSNYLKGKEQLYIHEVKTMISRYDDLKTSANNLLKSVQ